MFDELRKRHEIEYEAMEREYEAHMNRKHEAYMLTQEREYNFGVAVEEIRRFAREEVLTEIGKEASEHLLNVASGLEEFSGWNHLNQKEGGLK